MTGLQRREFLMAGTGGALLAGLPTAAFARLPAAAAPAKPGAIAPVAQIDFKNYRALLKKRNQPGVILVLPSASSGSAPGKANPEEQKKAKEQAARQRAAQLFRAPVAVNHVAAAVHGALMSTCSSELPQLLVQAVFVAAPADQVHREFPSIPVNAGLALINVDGKVIATLPASPQLGIKFTEHALQLVHGKDGSRLAERVNAERAALNAAERSQFETAVVDLDHDEFARREAASRTLEGLFDKIPASLAQAHRKALSLEVRTRIDTMFRRKLDSANLGQQLQQSLAPYAAAATGVNVRLRCGQGAFKPQAHEFAQRWCAAVARD